MLILGGLLTIGLSAMLSMPLTVAFARVTVVLPYAPAVAFTPVAIPRPPPLPAFLVTSNCSVTLVRLALAHAEKFAVPLASGRSVAIAATINVSATVVVAPGMAPLVSDVASMPPAVTSQGFPEVMAPRKARITPI